MLDIGSMTLPELEAQLVSLGQPKYRAKQIFRWLHVSGAVSFSEMTDLPLSLRGALSNNFVIFTCDIEKKYVSAYDNTVKYLYRLADGEWIESVVMQYKYGYSVCVSSQVGCRMGCKFCASTLDGVVRNLTASEILAQVYTAERDLGIRVSHVVMMGMGEPLDNYAQTLRFIRLITDPNGKNLSMRHISLSTCGIVPRIYDLMREDLQLTLSVSLHAPTDELRRSLMPVAKKWDLNALTEACRAYASGTSRRISFEYALIRGVNDTPECAVKLASLVGGMLCHVNLIPVNSVRETDCRESDPAVISRFSGILAGRGIPVTVRRRLGADINAACGQLRRKEKTSAGL